MAKKTIRRSQAVVPFGVGAIVDMPGESLMSAGIDAWPDEPKCLIKDDRLAHRLGVNFFRHPPPAEDTGTHGSRLPFIRFPLWHFCQACRKLERGKWNEPAPPKCSCSRGKKQLSMTPVRFVIACENGHIDDFPWLLWAHRKKNEDLDRVTVCDSPQLYLQITPASGLGGLRVFCSNCKSARTMLGSAGPNSLKGLKCSGNRPWLGPRGSEQACEAKPMLLQRGASNLYFPKLSSAILIPPFSNSIRKILDHPIYWQMLSANASDGSPDPQTIQLVATQLRCEPATLLNAVKAKLQGDDLTAATATENEFRHKEYNALSQKSSDSLSEFVTAPQSLDGYEQFIQDMFDRVVLVEKLAETRALTGFSRINPSPDNDFNKDDKKQLSLEEQTWLPAIRVYGEGLFLRFSNSTIDSWLTTDVKERIQTLIDSHVRMCQKLKRPIRNFPPRFFLLHTIAHCLIRRLSFDCGYGSSALRERLYCSDEKDLEMSGILIYTAAGDAEGTMGGLVQQGKQGRLEALFKNAIQDARWCSSDPLCIESSGQGIDSLNRAACYACTLIPETSCEEGNRYLDRGLLVGTPGNPNIGFFNNLFNTDK